MNFFLTLLIALPLSGPIPSKGPVSRQPSSQPPASDPSAAAIDDTHYIRVTFNTGRRRIQNLGQGFDQMKTHFDFIYTLLIRPTDNIPYQVIQFNNDNTDFIKTAFTHIQTSPPAPGELSWYYSTYTNEYKQARNDARRVPHILHH